MLKSKIYNILKVNLAACDALYYTVKEVAVKPWTHFLPQPLQNDSLHLQFDTLHQHYVYWSRALQ